MSEELGWAEMPIIPDLKRFGTQLREGTSRVVGAEGETAGRGFGTMFGTKASSAIHSKFSETAKYIIGPLVGAFAVEKIGDLVKGSIDAASDLQAARAKASVIFGSAAEDTEKYAERASRGLLLSNDAALQAETGFGILGQRMGLTDKQNAQFSQHFTRVAANLAAFNHSDPGAAFTAVERGITGSSRGLKPYGVLLSTASIQAEALATGILKPVKNQAAIHAAQVRVLADQQAYSAAIVAHGKNSLEAADGSLALQRAQDALTTATQGSVAPLTDQQKMLASAKLIIGQTTQEQGAAARSTHQWYGAQRQLSVSWDDAKDRLGKGLMPIAKDFVGELNREVIPAVDNASKWFEHKGGPAIHSFEQQLKPLVNSALPDLAGGLRDAYDIAKKFEPVATGLFKGFDKLPDWAQKGVIGAGITGLAAKKILGGSGSGLGNNLLATATGGAIGAVPVRVVNWGSGTLPGEPKVPGVPAGEEGAATKGLFGLGTFGSLGVLTGATGLLNEAQGYILGKEYGKTLGNGISIGLAGVFHLPPPLDVSAGTGSKGLGLFGDLFSMPKVGPAASPSLKSTATQSDALRASLQSASRSIDQIGPRADSAFGQASRDVAKFSLKLDELHDPQLTVDLHDQSAVRGLEQLQAIRLKDKELNVYEHAQLQDQAVGPGGGQGRHNPGGSGTGGGSGGGASTGRGAVPPIHVHVEVDKHEIAKVVLPMMDDHHDAQQRWQKIQAER